MAEPASNNEAMASVQAADQSMGFTSVNGTPRGAAIPAAPTPPEITFPTFQAVNAKAVVDGASASVSTAAQGIPPAPPPQVAAVTQSAALSGTPQPTKLSSELDDAANYGTRSRNRAGNARPNYAEDQEMDFEYSSKKKSTTEPAASSVASQNATDAKRAQLVSGSGTPSSANGTTNKESTPSATLNPSKKRKAAAPPVMPTQTPPATNWPMPAASRKVAAVSTIAAVSTVARETNVMTFSKHKSCLNKKGELVADDGSKLSVNGKPWRSPDKNCKVLLFEIAAYPASSDKAIQNANISQITCTWCASLPEIRTIYAG